MGRPTSRYGASFGDERIDLDPNALDGLLPAIDENDSILGPHIAKRTLDFANFKTNFTGIEIVSSLPTLPSSLYPAGHVVFLSSDNKLYRSTGSTWTTVVDSNDLAANSVTTNAINAGAVTAAKISVTTLAAIVADIGIITAGRLDNASSSPTAGIRLTSSYSKPGTWTRYVDFAATSSSPVFKHEAMSLNADGSADFSGTVSSSSFTANTAQFKDEIQVGDGGVFSEPLSILRESLSFGYLSGNSGRRPIISTVGGSGAVPSFITLLFGSTPAFEAALSASSVITLNSSGAHLFSSHTEFAEISAPSTPNANTVRVYAKDAGGISTLYHKNDLGTAYRLAHEVLLTNATTNTSTNNGETDLTSLTLPGGSLATDADMLHIKAWGIGSVTGSGVWQVKLYFGSTVIAQFSGTSTVEDVWHVDALVARTGSATQKASGLSFRNTSLVDQRRTSPAETLSSNVTIKTTGNNSSGLNTISVTTLGIVVEMLAQ